jgi:tetratricopeptide (TPR) repeat protein
MAERSEFQGFLSKYMPLGSDASKSSFDNYDEFLAHRFNYMKHGGTAKGSFASDNYPQNGLQGGINTALRPYEPAADSQDSMAFASSAIEPLATTMDADSPKITDKEERAVQKLLGNDGKMMSGPAAIGVVLLSIAAMLGFGIRRRRGIRQDAMLPSSGQLQQGEAARRAVLKTTMLAAVTTVPTLASANIGGADYVIGGARLSESITNPQGEVVVRLPRDAAEALARAATDYGSIGEAFAAEDGAAAAQVQAYFRSGGGYDALAESVQAVSSNKEAFPKSVRKAGKAFLAATAATMELYNTGDFDKALTQYESALTILAGFCASVGVVAGAPVAKPAKGPVTRRTYLPGPFQLL